MTDSTTAARRRRFAGLGASLALVALAVTAGGALAACGSHAGEWTAGSDTMATMAPATSPSDGAAAADPAVTTADDMAAAMEASWAARPAFVRRNGSATEEAYRFALERGDILQWMPCYCGCAAMDHRSNLDCFLRPGRSGLPTVFEEHASVCGICVETALMAKRMAADGQGLGAIRAAIDRAFPVSGVPGTDTALPPS